MNDKHYISLKEAIKITGIGEQTLRKLIDQKQIDGYKTPSGQRKFNKECLEKMCSSVSAMQTFQDSTMQNFLYARVSSKKQLEDLNRQIEFLKSRKPEYAFYRLVTDIGSGINFKRKGLSSILDSIVHRNVGEIVVAHRDRLSRFGFELIEQLVEKGGGKITVIDDERNKSTEQELSEDLLSIVHIYCCRQMGKRKYTTKADAESIKSET